MAIWAPPGGEHIMTHGIHGAHIIAGTDGIAGTCGIHGTHGLPTVLMARVSVDTE